MKKVLSFVFSFVFIIFVAYLAFQFITGAIRSYGNMNVSLQTAIASAVSLIIVASIGFFANKTIEQKKSIEASIRPRKLELYEEFISFFLKVLGNGKVYPKPTQKEIMKFFADSNPLLMTFASNKVIEKWGKLRLKMADGDDVNNMLQLEGLLIEIRKDLGHTSTGLHKGDILRLVVNDIDDYLSKK